MSNEYFNPEMLTLAREFRNYTQKELSEATGIRQSVLSRFENGSLSVSNQQIETLSKALSLPKGFFRQSDDVVGLGASFLFHRKRQTMRVRDLKQVQAMMNVSAMHLRRLLRGIEMEHNYSFAPMEVGEDGTPEEIARLLRASWRLREGPIHNLTAAVERAGGIVVRLPFASKQVDGISLWLSDLPPIFFLNSHMPGDRDRWTLAHEIGHTIMHRHVHQDVEHEADAFASEFLMPEEEIRPELSNMTLAKAMQLKPVWGVSMQGLIVRAKTLKVITERKCRYLFMQMSKAGYRKQEPNPYPKERARNLQVLMNVHEVDHGYTAVELAQLANANSEEFCEFYRPNRKQLRLVD